MMQARVEGGTGTAAQIPGVTVGGKTGTAETGIAGLNTTWFISYAGRNRARGRNRGRRRGTELDRRRNGRAGRPRRLAGAFGGERELLTWYRLWQSHDTLIDTLFDGRYLIIRKLGSGGMANVYLAADQELGRRVAIKILDDRHARDEQFVERFRREAQNAAGLSHPNIVSIYDRGDSEGTYYIAMEYVEGRTLKELLVARGPSPLGIAIDYTRQILSALRFAHRNGIVHRDIKPHNVIVDGEGRVKVMDFGIARAGAASQMTEAGSIIGTAQYLSPEQARGAPVDQTSDLYSTGIVLYELLTGSVPFTGETPVEIAMKHLSQAPVSPSAHRPEIPRDLDYVVLRALAKDPADRYHSAEEMDSDLERIARGIGVSAETAEAATTVLSRTDVGEAATTIGPAAVTSTTYTPGRYYEYDEPPRKRTIWPWLLAVAAGRRRARRRLVRLPGAAGSARQPPSRSPCPTSRAHGAARRHEHPRRRASRSSCSASRTRTSRSASSPSRTRSRATGPRRATSSRSSSRPGRRRSRSRTSSARAVIRRSRPRQRRAESRTSFPVNSLEAGQHGARDAPEGRHRAGRGLDRPRQRLEGAEAGHGPERDRVSAFETRAVARSRAPASRSPARTSRIRRPPERSSARTRPPARNRARDP